MIRCAIDGCGGREDEVMDTVARDEIEHLGGGVEVDLEVLIGLLHGFTDCFEGCGVDDAVGLVGGENFIKLCGVADIGDD